MQNASHNQLHQLSVNLRTVLEYFAPSKLLKIFYVMFLVFIDKIYVSLRFEFTLSLLSDNYLNGSCGIIAQLDPTFIITTKEQFQRHQ